MKYYFWIPCIIFFLSSCTKKVFTVAERNLLITPQDFEVYEIYFANADSIGKFKKLGFVDGSIELKYEFETNQEDTTELYINNIISIEKTKLEAKLTYAAEKGGVKLGKISKIHFKELDDIFTYGDASKFYLLETKKGEPIGNLFQCRKGKFVYFIVFSGVYFDDKDDWSEFILPKLNAIDAHSNN